MIPVTKRICIDESELRYLATTAGGPGGQKANRTASAVQLRFDLEASDSLPPDVKKRLRRVAGHRITEAGVLVIDARRKRTQKQNRRDARQRLIALLREAAHPPKPRRRTRPPSRSRENRLKRKKIRGERKRLRGRIDHQQD